PPGLPLRRDPIQVLDAAASFLGCLLVTTVHRFAELEQEPVTSDRHASELLPERVHLSPCTTTRRKRFRGDPTATPKRVERSRLRCLARRLSLGRLQEREHEEDSDPEQDQPVRPVAADEEQDRDRRRCSGQYECEE